MTNVSPPPQLYLDTGSALLLGSIPDGHSHAHLALQLAIGLGGPLRLSVDGKERAYAGVLISSQQRHQLRSPPGGVLMLLVDPTTTLGAGEAGAAAGVRELPALELPPLVEAARALLTAGVDPAQARALHQRCCALLTGGGDARRDRALDARVRQTLARLDAPGSELEPPSLDQLAAAVSLSPGRLRHLFRAQVGLSIRSYRSWARLGRAIDFLAAGETLTRAAHSAGFVDSAHLSRSFRQLFGLPPSALTGAAEICRLEPAR